MKKKMVEKYTLNNFPINLLIKCIYRGKTVNNIGVNFMKHEGLELIEKLVQLSQQ